MLHPHVLASCQRSHHSHVHISSRLRLQPWGSGVDELQRAVAGLAEAALRQHIKATAGRRESDLMCRDHHDCLQSASPPVLECPALQQYAGSISAHVGCAPRSAPLVASSDPPFSCRHPAWASGTYPTAGTSRPRFPSLSSPGRAPARTSAQHREALVATGPEQANATGVQA